MGFKLPYPASDYQNQCIGCACLGIDKNGKGDGGELDVEGRLGIPEEGYDPHLRCYKGLLTPDKIQRGATCPKKNDWIPYAIGISPITALQAARHHTQIRVTIITAMIVIVVTVILGILNLMSK